MNLKVDTKEILYLGPEGSYTEMAKDIATELLGLDAHKLVMLLNIQEIISSVDNDKNLIGVVPVENSIEGLVRETVDKIIRTKNYVRIFQEIIVPISHCLVNKDGDISKVKNIISHPQALAQCSNYIYNLGKKLGRDLELTNSPSTSEAASCIRGMDETYAVIANEKAASIYGLQVVERNINDEPDNKTRFVCIGHEYPKKTGNDRTSIAFTTVNKPGALVAVLNIFKENDLNMSYIDSRPSKRFLGEYTFYIDLDGHVEDEKVKRALIEIKPLTTFYRLIGSYPRYVNKSNE